MASLTLSFASVRASLARRGGFAARTSTAVRASARSVAAAAGMPDVSPDAFVVTYCHVSNVLDPKASSHSP